MQLKDKVAIVTGSTKGIGATIARVFAAAGAQVVVSGRSVAAGEAVADEIRHSGGRAAFIAAEDQFVVDFQSLCDTAQAVGTVVVVGGRAFHEAIRLRLKYCCYCDTMQQLEQFARSARQLGTTALGTTALGTTALGTTALGTTASKSK